MKKDFIRIPDLTRDEIDGIFNTAFELKRGSPSETGQAPLKGKTLIMIFHKPSLRTRVSFEVGMARLGGRAVHLRDEEIGVDSREKLEDVGKVLSRYGDGIMIRTFRNEWVERLASASSIPVVNGLTDIHHPCQVLADIFTLKEKNLDPDKMIVAYLGDGNNVCNSWIDATQRFGFELRVAHPQGYSPDPDVLAEAGKKGKGKVLLTQDPREAAKGADVIYTDVWASMGKESEREARARQFKPYQVNRTAVSLAKKNCLVMHCLPAHRGDEITDDVIDGPNSIVFDEAENRMHLQNGLLATLLGRKK
ncbi:MAG: ornithine carbamoyltransferase [Candidatus Eisenbacteria bacterium]|nr:ornithine carbamoyltransferase [Candidatus Eisenbacteria bacterium]